MLGSHCHQASPNRNQKQLTQIFQVEDFDTARQHP
ncbi:unnamed protein product, partial [Rotaria magnacalcarata]